MHKFLKLSPILFGVILSFYCQQVFSSPPLKVVASFSILGDLVRQIGGESIDLQTIVGPNEDTHVYEPTPKDVKRVAEANLVFINGFGFEGWIERLIEASGYKGPVVVVSSEITPRYDSTYCKCKSKHHHLDPHAWHNVPNVKSYISVIAKALSQKDPEHKDLYQMNAQTYQKKLDKIEHIIQKDFSEVPIAKRVAITTHDGFGYFGDHYGIQFLSPVGLSTESEPSAKTIAQLIDFIKSHEIKVLFLENITSPKLMEQIASETNANLGAVLYSDALSDASGPASTYLQMMEYNAKALAMGMR